MDEPVSPLVDGLVRKYGTVIGDVIHYVKGREEDGVAFCGEQFTQRVIPEVGKFCVCWECRLQWWLS